MELQVLSYNKSPTGNNQIAKALDLSAGGVRLKWPDTLPSPQQNAIIKGILTLPGGKELELEAEIRHISKTPAGAEVGAEFLNLSVRDEQSLLFVCMQFQREQMRISDR